MNTTDATPKMGSAEIAVQLQRAPKVKQISLAKIHNPEYQRPLDEARVRKIVKEFDINKVRPPLLVEDENGNLEAVDGKHTIEVLKRTGFTYWPVCLVAPMNRKEAIKRFMTQLQDVRPPRPEDRLRAGSLGFIEPGGHGDYDFRRAHDITSGIEMAGWTFSGSKKNRTPKTIGASSGLEEVYDRAEDHRKGSGQRTVTNVLDSLQTIWPNDTTVSSDANLHRAFGKIFRAYGALSSEEIAKLRGIPSNTFATITKGMGSQSEKRDTISDYLVKALGKRRSKVYHTV